AQRFGEGNAIETFRVWIFDRVAIVNAVHFRCLQNHIRAELARAQRGGGVGGEIWIARAGCENYNASELEMPDRASENERLGHVFHFNRGLDARFDSDFGEGAT